MTLKISGTTTTTLPKPTGTCQKCHKRPATAFWTGDEGTIAFIHGFYQMWCEICCVEEQLKVARKSAERIPEMEKHLADLKAKEPNDG